MKCFACHSWSEIGFVTFRYVNVRFVVFFFLLIINVFIFSKNNTSSLSNLRR